jgi:hypothetical protein
MPRVVVIIKNKPALVGGAVAAGLLFMLGRGRGR